MMFRRIVAGLAAGTIANSIQMAICLVDARIITFPLVISHWIFVSLFHIAAATLFAQVSNNRLWSALVFWVPVTSVAARELDRLFGVWGAIAGAVCAAVLGAWWTKFIPRRGAPFVSAAAGAIVGAMLPYMHEQAYTSQLGVESLVALATLLFVVAALAALFAGRPAGPLVPRMPWSLRRLAGFSFAGLLPILFTHPVEIPPPPTSESASGPSTILVVLDTVRADHLELYGYERETMPALTRFARESAVLAERAISNAPSSLPSHASLFTGLYPVRHGAHKPFLKDPNPPEYAYRLDPRIPTLATIMAKANYWTVGISGNSGPLSPFFGLSQGFQVYHAMPSPRRAFVAFSPWGIEEISNVWLERIALAFSTVLPFTRDYLLGVPYKRAGEITDEAIKAIELAGDRPFLLFLNYMDAHSPYFPPANFIDRFPGRSSSLLTSGFDEARWEAVVDGEAQLGDDERRHYTALYDAELSYLDTELDRLLSWLRRRPDWDEMLIVITSDHGEAIGDHGGLEHSNSLYDEITHVPLIVKPGIRTPDSAPAGSVLSGLVESVDIFPLVLEHSGLRVPNDIDGIAWGAGRTHAFGWLYPSTDRQNAEELRSVQGGGWKLVESSSGKVELYHVDRDPAETLDLSVAESKIRWKLTKTLNEIRHKVDRPPSQTPDLSKEMTDELRALGYVK